MRAALLTLVLLALPGCGPKAVDTSRAVLDAAATTTVEMEDTRISYQAHRDQVCRARVGSFPAWRECMAPAYRLDQAVGVFRGLLLATEAAIDASGADGWIAMAPCLVSSAAELSTALTEAGLPIPSQVSAIAQLAANVAGECSQ